jgi:hypothetical protein
MLNTRSARIPFSLEAPQRGGGIMKTSRLTRILALPLAAALLAVSGPVSAQFDDKPTVLEWEFDVFLDDKPIGGHEFRLVHEGTDPDDGD